jgi:hypothetical protein
MVLFGIALALGTTGRVALGEDSKFKFTNQAPETIYINLYSKTRDGWTWPGVRKHWVLNPGQVATVSAGECQAGEKICYGGSNKASTRYWGVSLSGKKGCANCCNTCGDSRGWTLSEHVDPPSHQPPPQSHVDDGPALVPVEE